MCATKSPDETSSHCEHSLRSSRGNRTRESAHAHVPEKILTHNGDKRADRRPSDKVRSASWLTEDKQRRTRTIAVGDGRRVSSRAFRCRLEEHHARRGQMTAQYAYERRCRGWDGQTHADARPRVYRWRSWTKRRHRRPGRCPRRCPRSSWRMWWSSRRERRRGHNGHAQAS